MEKTFNTPNQRPQSNNYGSPTRQPNGYAPRGGGVMQRPTNPSQQPVPKVFGGQSTVVPKTLAGQQPPQNSSQATQQFAKQTPSSVNQSPSKNAVSKNEGIDRFVACVKEMVGGFCYLSDEVIASNMILASGQGMTNDDRKIPFECANYIMSHFGIIVMGLVTDSNFRQSFVEALSLEMQIDKESDEEKKRIRESLKDKKNYDSDGYIILGMTSFAPNVSKILYDKLMYSFDVLDRFGDEFDELANALQNQEKVELGFIFSNWMYLIRAFTHNDVFLGYIVTVVEEFKKVMNIQIQ